MFNIKINDNNYAVYGEYEFAFIGNLVTPIMSVPEYFDLEFVAGNKPAFKLINNTPLIINTDTLIDQSPFTYSTNVNYSSIYPLDIEEYEILYTLYQKEMEKNPDEDYQMQMQIKNDIESAKKLIKTTKKDCK